MTLPEIALLRIGQRTACTLALDERATRVGTPGLFSTRSLGPWVEAGGVAQVPKAHRAEDEKP